MVTGQYIQRGLAHQNRCRSIRIPAKPSQLLDSSFGELKLKVENLTKWEMFYKDENTKLHEGVRMLENRKKVRAGLIAQPHRFGIQVYCAILANGNDRDW